MAKYKASFSGFVYIEAENVEEVEEKFDDEEFVFAEYRIDEIIEVDEFTVEV